jgi:hypothetical protein
LEAAAAQPLPSGPPAGPGARIYQFPRSPISPSGAAESSSALGMLGRCLGVIALGLTPNPNAGGECSAAYPPPESNCPQNDERCAKALADARRIYEKLRLRRIPEYMQNSRAGTGTDNYYSTIIQDFVNLRHALGQIRLYCKTLPEDLAKMEQFANQEFPVRH